ncbi:hypothetical protein SAMN05216313_102277 [Enterocloster lavalensis]|uniref:Uncharacterized protein n=1 Tax=Enterocloster lavalensis TaxID=460384 RepID=A0A1I0C3V1_9FIRM|nr:hypothetical protein SAMN05216313_102277 [Enterocloster lavalensis]
MDKSFYAGDFYNMLLCRQVDGAEETPANEFLCFVKGNC